MLVHGVSSDRGALGYFGHAYYVESAHMMKLVAVDGGDGCVLPGRETIESGTYKPLTRPLLLYVDRAALQREEVVTLMRFYFENAGRMAEDVGYVPLPDEQYEANLNEIG